MRTLPVATAFDAMASITMGRDSQAPEWMPAAFDGIHRALERAILGALVRPPCFVSFSGGRDSSLILALATDLARREGLEAPIPATLRFPAAPSTDESDWQRLVLDHLEIRHREIIDLDDELDLLGPDAVAMLRDHGPHWPANIYVHTPILRLAAGGSLLTGVGGDEILGGQGSRHLRVLMRVTPLQRHDWRTFALAAAPNPLVRRRRAAQADPHAWLTPEGNALLADARARAQVAWPHGAERAMMHWHGSRSFAAISAGIGTLGAQYDVQVVQPLIEPEALSTLARTAGAAGFGNRTVTINHLARGLLPRKLIMRDTKAEFSSAVWGPATRRFAREWDGAGVSPALIDVPRLRAEWLRPRPDFRSALLLQRAWLAGAISPESHPPDGP